MFGGGRNNKKKESLSSVMAPDNAPKASNNGGGNNSVTGFDPEGLERAAKAARDLDASRNAGSAIELIKTQEATKQHEAASKRAEYDAYTQQQRATNIEREGAEARKTLDAKTHHERTRAEYADELERKRQVDMLNAQKYMQEENLKKQEEMAMRQEQMRMKTAEREAELRTKSELARTAAEAQGRIRQERENHDLILEKTRLEAVEYRDTLLKAVADGGKMVGEGLKTFLEDKEKLRNTAALFVGIAAGGYAAKTGFGVLGRYVESRLGKPSLVRETSRIVPTAFVHSPIKTAGQLWKRAAGPSAAGSSAVDGVVLEPNLEQRLKRVAISASNAKTNRAPFRHLLLHGPPGTGKTLFARNLARTSGLDFAVFTGGDLAPLGRDAVTELHALFGWAETSKRGLLLFIDEADAFLGSRDGVVGRNPSQKRQRKQQQYEQLNEEVGEGRSNTEHQQQRQQDLPHMQRQPPSEDQRNALNAFLYRTGTESDRFMVVYASNVPHELDRAVLDRIDEMVEFELPGEVERRRMIAMYLEKYLVNPPPGARKVRTVGVDEKEVEDVVQMTEGFSGRAISKLAIGWQAAAYGTAGAVLDKETFLRTVDDHRSSMVTKANWMNEEVADSLTTDR